MKVSLPEDAVATYEALRPHLVDAEHDPGSGAGRAVLLRRGMLAWASTCNQVPVPPAVLRPAPNSPLPYDVVRELVQVMAGLILSSGRDGHYA